MKNYNNAKPGLKPINTSNEESNLHNLVEFMKEINNEQKLMGKTMQAYMHKLSNSEDLNTGTDEGRNRTLVNTNDKTMDTSEPNNTEHASIRSHNNTHEHQDTNNTWKSNVIQPNIRNKTLAIDTDAKASKPHAENNTSSSLSLPLFSLY